MDGAKSDARALVSTDNLRQSVYVQFGQQDKWAINTARARAFKPHF